MFHGAFFRSFEKRCNRCGGAGRLTCGSCVGYGYCRKLDKRGDRWKEAIMDRLDDPYLFWEAPQKNMYMCPFCAAQVRLAPSP